MVKMLGFQKVLTISTLAVSALASPRHLQHEDSLVDWERLSNLIDTIDSRVLHQVLHSLAPKFQDGVFSRDRSAVEVVHSENPIVASKLVYIARRQSNSTTTGGEPTPSTPAQSSVAESVSSILTSQITASELPSPTSIFIPPTTPPGATPVATVSNGIVYSTVGGGLITVTSQEIGVSFTRSTSTRLFYTTLPDGSVQTSTSLIVVNAPVTATAAATGAAGEDSTSTPGLQNAAVKATGAAVMGLLAGAAGVLAAAV